LKDIAPEKFDEVSRDIEEKIPAVFTTSFGVKNL